jgi:equilibrative nucleoside transporter 1/2/3
MVTCRTAVVALSALFGPSYLQGILSGQGGIGAIVSLCQLFAAIGSSSSSSSAGTAVAAKDPLEQYADQLRNSAFVFFLIATVMTAFALLCHFTLIRLPFYRLTIRGAEQSKATDKAGGDDVEDQPVSLWTVVYKVRVLGVAVFWIFFVTLSVFPAITASILSVHEIDDDAGLSFFSPTVFVPVGFVIFNFGDWMGRAAPQWARLRFRSTRILCIASAIRIVFVVRAFGLDVSADLI